MRAKISLTLCSFLLCLAVCEVLLRALNYQPTMLDRDMYQAKNDPLRPYTLTPNYATSSIHIDANGKREIAPKCGGRSLLLLGDSVVFGQGLTDSETIGSQLQGKLCGQYAVQNIGVPGYSSWNEYAAFRDSDPVDDLILVYVPNDPTFENDHMKVSSDGIADVAKDRPHRTLRFLYSHLRVSHLIGSGLRSALAGGHTYIIDPHAVTYSMEALEKVRDICADRGVRFRVAVYRDVWWYSDPQAKVYETMISDELSKRGISSFVLKSHIEHLTEREAKVAFNDPHPSAKAVQFIVEDIQANL